MPALPVFRWNDKPSVDDMAYQSTQHVLDMIDAINADQQYPVKTLPKYDYEKRANQFAKRTDQLRNQLATKRAQHRNQLLRNSPFTWKNAGFRLPKNMNMGGGGGSFNNFLQAISGQESGGNYGIVNRDSGAMGKYQVMPSNIPSWSAQVLGHSVSPSYFLSHPKVQERIVRGIMRNNVRRYGYQGAASTWYSGSPTKYKTTAGGGSYAHAYPSVANYVASIMRRMR